jgi:chemotaxis protein histidine kinase CheA/ActR/RegA family two-component response regulator
MSFLHALEGFSRALVSDADFDVGGRERAREFQTLAGQLATAAKAEGLNGLSQAWRLLERSFASLHSAGGEGLGGAVLGAWRRIASLVRSGGEGVSEELRDLLAPLPELMAACVGREFDATEALITALHALPFLDGELDEIDAALRSDVRHLAPVRAPRIVPRELMHTDTMEILMSAKQFVELARAGGDTSSAGNFDDLASPMKVESFAADTAESNKNIAQDSLPNFSAAGPSTQDKSHETTASLQIPEIPALAWQSTSSTRPEDRGQGSEDRRQRTEDRAAVPMHDVLFPESHVARSITATPEAVADAPWQDLAPASEEVALPDLAQPVDDFALDAPVKATDLDLFENDSPSSPAEVAVDQDSIDLFGGPEPIQGEAPVPAADPEFAFDALPVPGLAEVTDKADVLAFDEYPDQAQAEVPAPAVPEFAFDAMPGPGVAEVRSKADELSFDPYPAQARADIAAPATPEAFAFDALPEPSVAQARAKADELAFDDMALPVPNQSLFDEPVPASAQSMMFDDLVAREPSASQAANPDELFMPDNLAGENSGGLLKGISGFVKKVAHAVGIGSGRNERAGAAPAMDDLLMAEASGSDDLLMAEEPATALADSKLPDEFSLGDLRAAPAGAQDLLAEDDTPGPTLSTGAMQIIEVLQAELPEIHATIAAFSGLSRSAGVDTHIVAEARERCIEMLARFGGAAGSVGFAGLGTVFEYAANNIRAVAGDGNLLTEEQAELLVEFGVHVRDYLDAPLTAERSARLVNWLAFEGWPLPVPQAAARVLSQSLRHPDFSMLEEGITSREHTASEEDVSLDIPEDVNKDLLDGMLQELPGQSEAFSAAIERLTRGGDIDDINLAQRIAHTIKGSGNTVGIRGLASLTHNLEDILLALAKEGILPAPALANSLINASDCLQAMTEFLLGMGPAPDDARATLQEVLDWANRIDTQGLPKSDDGGLKTEDRVQRTEARVQKTEDRGQKTEDRAAADEAPMGDAKAAAAKDGQPEADAGASLRVAASLIDQLLAGTGENIILTGQLRDGAQRALTDLRSMQAQFDLLQQLGAELEEMIDVKDFSSRQTRGKEAGFDALEMDQYNELHTCARRLAEAATDARELGRGVIGHISGVDELLITQEGHNRDTQDLVMRTRMVEVKTMFPRLQRSVRQACRMLEKVVDLHLAGGDTPMDSDVLNKIADPLMHLLRNAIDHGIEAEAMRTAAGKKAVGNVWLEFSREGNNILVRCRDDGAGLDFASIRRAAIERGVISSTEDASEEMLKQFILRPNFSTRAQATQVSGRGIGLDAVQTGVSELGGTLQINSREGQGCTFEFRLPFNLISSHALLIRAGAEIMAVASRGIEQIVHPADGSTQRMGSETVFRLGDNFYPMRAIEEALGTTVNRRSGERGSRPVILAKTARMTVAVQVDAVLGSRDMVVKSLGAYFPKVRGVIGATILGDGKVSPVLDLPDLLGEDKHGSGSTTMTVAGRGSVGEAAPSGRKCVLVVDDSLSARRALAQFIQDCGYEVRSARDGLEAAQIVAGRLPDLVIADMEMPRMNGIELTAHLRATPASAKVPVIMITSRSTAKHKEQAMAAGVNVYLNKPYSEDTLLAKVRELLAGEMEIKRARTGTYA